MTNNNLIQTFDLTKVYKLKGKQQGIRALNKVNLSIKEGEIFGLLGPNGAGKTTMIQILTTILQPTSGYVTIRGYNILKKPNEAKSKIALMLESDMLYYRITGYDNLKFFCKIYKIPNYKERIHEVSKEFGLKNWLNQYVENYSSGMKMKLALCRTFVLDRDILILDEPTLGLDVKSISFITEKLKESNKTIFMTSHDMSVVEKLCDRIAFINNGKIIKIGTKEDLKRLEQNEVNIEVRIVEKKSQLKDDLNKQDYVDKIEENNDEFIISLNDRNRYKDLLSILANYNIQKVKEQELSLEDLFIKFN